MTCPTLTSATGSTITFNLTAPNADFNYLMAMAASAPVPYKTEGGPGFKGATYTKHPMASGPYMIKSYTPNKTIVFVRNPQLDAGTDTIRHPLVNEVDLTIDTNPEDLDKQAGGGQRTRTPPVARAASPRRSRAKILTDPNAQGERRRPGRSRHPVLPCDAVGDPERALPERDLLRDQQGVHTQRVRWPDVW